MADVKLKRAVGVVRPLHGLWVQGEWNLLDGTQGREAPLRKKFEKAALPRGCGLAIGLHEGGKRVRPCGGREGARIVFVGLLLTIFLQPAALAQTTGEKKANKSATTCPGTGTRPLGRTRTWATLRDTRGGEKKPPTRRQLVWQRNRRGGRREQGRLPPRRRGTLLFANNEAKVEEWCSARGVVSHQRDGQ